ncbi:MULTISPECIES: hypothetical protein [Edaphosphingomonas]|uniref:Uncharacterized protein n=1 Tax=Edaphosphingomonas haloaromaticamans TaxID=653954 RepID=A0A1S1HKU0_9SPHN|nr:MULTISPECIES: hypothetical protein [Sphingomonas]MDX3884255.1 hypothetical protein [Sphingomonas sp.]OHT21150.1 hypothetical protein BHE75_03155 [Sphingomonas haloaromaticamans]
MTVPSLSDYLLSREKISITAARDATHSSARIAHEQLAAAYHARRMAEAPSPPRKQD